MAVSVSRLFPVSPLCLPTLSRTLRTQVEALRSILDETEVWHDFSQVEWRIRIGQLLWTDQADKDVPLDEHLQPSERDVLLQQIMLAAELLLRLDMLKTVMPSASSAYVERCALAPAQLSRKIQWDLLLAQTFLENVTFSAEVRDSSSKPTNRSSLFSAISFLTAKETPEQSDQAIYPLFLPKNEKLQLAGLLYFAESTGWPHAQDVHGELEAKLATSALETDRRTKQHQVASSLRPLSTASAYATPLSSPAFSRRFLILGCMALARGRTGGAGASKVTHSAPLSKAHSGSASSLNDMEKELPPFPAHALHIDYQFHVVHVATLLSAPPAGTFFAGTAPRPAFGGELRAEEIVVLDCRGTKDLEVLARAWCAKVGENALVGKRGGHVWRAVHVRPGRWALGLLSEHEW